MCRNSLTPPMPTPIQAPGPCPNFGEINMPRATALCGFPYVVVHTSSAMEHHQARSSVVPSTWSTVSCPHGHSKKNAEKACSGVTPPVRVFERCLVLSKTGLEGRAERESESLLSPKFPVLTHLQSLTTSLQ